MAINNNYFDDDTDTVKTLELLPENFDGIKTIETLFDNDSGENDILPEDFDRIKTIETLFDDDPGEGDILPEYRVKTAELFPIDENGHIKRKLNSISFMPKNNQPKKCRWRIVDEISRKMTVIDFLPYEIDGVFLEKLCDCGFLSAPWHKYKITRKDYSSNTLYVNAEDAEDLKVNCALARFYKKYPMTIKWLDNENNWHSFKTVCNGFDRRWDIERKIPCETTCLDWPGNIVTDEGWVSCDYLCQLDPAADSVFVFQDPCRVTKYSGLIVSDDIKVHPYLNIPNNKTVIKDNLEKIKKLPKELCDKILEIPQFEIFFEGNVPYYITNNDSVKKELPKSNGGDWYYDPVEDTEAYKMVIEEVQKEAQKIHEDELMKAFGTIHVLGGVHGYFGIESKILYEKYGICCINHPMDLNLGLFID